MLPIFVACQPLTIRHPVNTPRMGHRPVCEICRSGLGLKDRTWRYVEISSTEGYSVDWDLSWLVDSNFPLLNEDFILIWYHITILYCFLITAFQLTPYSWKRIGFPDFLGNWYNWYDVLVVALQIRKGHKSIPRPCFKLPGQKFIYNDTTIFTIIYIHLRIYTSHNCITYLLIYT